MTLTNLSTISESDPLYIIIALVVILLLWVIMRTMNKKQK